MENGDILFYTGKGEPYRHGRQDKGITNARLPEVGTYNPTKLWHA